MANNNVKVKITVDDKGAVKAIDTFDKELSKAQKSSKGLTKETAKLDKKLKAISRPDKPIKHLNKELPKATKEVGALSQGFGKLGAAVVGAIGVNLISDVVRGMADLNKELLMTGVRAQGVIKAFNNISGSSLKDLRDSVQGTVSDFTLMQAAVKGDKFNIPIEKMGKLLQFARQSAKDTGESVDELASKISIAIGRKSLLILDDFGITASQINEALGGMSAQAATVGQLTDAVLKIAQGTMQHANNTIDTADAYNQLLATIENVKLQGGEMLVNSDELKTTIQSLTKTITTAAPSILQFVTEWGVGALKIADAMGKVAGFIADAFTTSTFEKYLEELGTQNELWDELVNKKRLLSDLENSALANKKQEISNAEREIRNAELRWLKQKAYVSTINDLLKEQDKEKEDTHKKEINRIDELKSKLSVGSNTLATETIKLTANNIVMGGGPEGDNDSFIGNNRSPGLNSNMSSIEKSEMYGNINNSLLEASRADMKSSYDAQKEAAEKSLKLAQEAEKERIEINKNMLNIAADAFSTMTSIQATWANNSLNTFGKIAGSIGGSSSLIGSLIGGPYGAAIGGLIGEGANFLGSVFGQAEESSLPSSSLSDSTALSSASKPSATINRTGPETEIKHYNITITDSNIMADEEGTMDIARRVLTSMSMIQGASA